MSSEVKLNLCLDFDGVCHSYTSGWQGADVIPDPPVDGMFDFLEEASEHFVIFIFSSRSHQLGGIEAMQNWFIEQWFIEFGWKLPPNYLFELQFPETKPPAWVSLDDRGLNFSGQWPTIRKLKDFRPWNK
jgi:hypothetical protein